MKKLLLLTSLLLFSQLSFAQFSLESEAFEINGELILREGDQFLWQNGTNLVYLGSLKKIPEYRNLPQYHERTELLNALINDFLANVLTQSRAQAKDSIFVDGFVIDQTDLKAVAVKYTHDEPFTVYIGLRAFKKEIEKTPPNTFRELFQGFIDQLNAEGTANYSLGLHRSDSDGWDNCFHVHRNNSEIMRLHQHYEFGSYTDNVSSALSTINEASYGSFLTKLLTKPDKVKYKSDNSYHLYASASITDREMEILRKAFLGNDVVTKVERDSVEVKNLETAKSWGKYDFMVNYLAREYRHPVEGTDEKREIMYLAPDLPIFVQDSVLDYFDAGEFKNVSDKRIDSRYKDYLLPELIYRIRNNQPTRTAGSISAVAGIGVKFGFEKEDFTVIAEMQDGDDPNYYYIIGWDEVQDPVKFVALLKKYDVPGRMPLQIKTIGEDLILILPEDDGYNISLWDPENKQQEPLAHITNRLTDVQRNLAIEAVFERFKINKGDCNPVALGDFANTPTQLILRFPKEPETIHLYQKTAPDSGKHITLTGLKYNNNFQNYYASMLNDNRTEGSFRNWTINGVPVALGSDHWVWSQGQGNMVPLVQFDTIRPQTHLRDKLISLLKAAGRSNLKVNYWSSNDDYLVTHDPQAASIELVSKRSDLAPMIKMNGYAPFAIEKFESLTSAILNQAAVQQTDELIISGTPAQPAWLVSMAGNHFLSGNRLNNLVEMGSNFETDDIPGNWFLEHLMNLVVDHQFEPVLTSLTQQDARWLYGVEAESYQIRSVSSEPGHFAQVLNGELIQQDYQNSPMTTLLLDLYTQADTITTRTVSDEYISITKKNLAFWKTDRNELHQPATIISDFNGSLKTQIIRLLTDLYKQNTDLTVEAEGLIGQQLSHSIYYPLEAQWYLLNEKSSSPIKIKVNKSPQSLGAEMADLLITDFLLNKVNEYDYTRKRNYDFLHRADRVLIRVGDTQGLKQWNELGSILDLTAETDPKLFDKLLELLAEKEEIVQLSEFQLLNLNDYHIALFSDLEDSYHTLISPTVQQNEAKCVLQKQHKELISALILNQYFHQLYKGSRSDNIEILNIPEKGCSSFYDLDVRKWFFDIGKNSLNPVQISPAEFQNIKEADNHEDKALLMQSLFTNHTPAPRIGIGIHGFYYYWKPDTIVLAHSVFQNSGCTYSVNLPLLKTEISNRLLPAYLANYSSLDVLIKRMLDVLLTVSDKAAWLQALNLQNRPISLNQNRLQCY